MWQSLRISHAFIRLSLTAFFFWFGVDKFFHPTYWLQAWIPQSVINAGTLVHISGSAIVYSFGIIELLIGISLASNMFVSFFASIAALFLVITPFFYGFNEFLVYNIVLVGSLLALVFWPNRSFRNY